MPPKADDIEKLAKGLLSNGPVRTLPAFPRRVRILHQGVRVADTTSALYVWEHDHYPYFYVPQSDLKNVQVHAGRSIDGPSAETPGRAIVSSLSMKETAGNDDHSNIVSEAALLFEVKEGPAKALNELVRIPFGDPDQWLEEDLPITVHPKDPYKRLDLLPSTRRITVTIPDGDRSGQEALVLADTPFAVHLFETGLPVRYYMPLARLKTALMRPSANGTRTLCPYKGEAEYYDIHLPSGAILPDLIWYYARPTPECAAVAGMCCFYSEKVDVAVDGVAMERPRTHFA